MRVRRTPEEKRAYGRKWWTTYPNSPRVWIRTYKESHPCKDCGRVYPAHVMDFDHLHDKVASVNQIVREGSLDDVKVEIEKCELVCSNCHRIRTFNRKNSKLTRQ